ncbi:hypothetical protein EV1_041629 [Malus domestica]
MLALKQGYEVSGSDIAWSSFTDGLQEAWALLHTGIQAARPRFPVKSFMVVFQPHMYSRLAAMKDDFANALRGADQAVVTEGVEKQSNPFVATLSYAVNLVRWRSNYRKKIVWRKQKLRLG